MVSDCTVADGHSYQPFEDFVVDSIEIRFKTDDNELVHSYAVAYVTCEFCDLKKEVELECRNFSQLKDDFDKWLAKEADGENNIHYVALSCVDGEIRGDTLYAEAQLAVFYEGEYDPQYPLESKYVYEC